MQVIFIMQLRYVPVLIRFLPHQNILAQHSISAPRFPSDFCLIKTQWCFLISIAKLKVWFGLLVCAIHLHLFFFYHNVNIEPRRKNDANDVMESGGCAQRMILTRKFGLIC